MGHTYLHNRNGTFYFRMALPEPLQKRFGQREFLYSLATKNYPEARRRCLSLARMAHELLMKIELTLTLTPADVQRISRAYFTEGLARLRTHVANVDEAYAFSEMLAHGDTGRLLPAQELIRQPLFYLPDSMDGVLARDAKGEVTQGAFKVGGIPMTMKPVGLDDILAHVLKTHNLTLSSTSPGYMRLRHGVQQAVTELGNIQRQYADFVPEPVAQDDMFKDLVKATQAKLVDMPPSKPFSEIVQAYEDDVKGGIEGQTMKRKKVAYAWFMEAFGDIPIQTVTKRQHANEFKTLLAKLPKNAEQRHKGKTVKELATVGGDKLSYRTQDIYLTAMRSLFEWAIEKAGYYEGDNPFNKVNPPAQASKADDEEEGNPFSKETLKALFASSIYTGHKGQRTKAGKELVKDSLYWVPLLSLFTGARMQEICQLYASDIREEEGVWLMDINAAGADKHLKVSHSKRLVPIHPQLVTLGFLDYAKRQTAQGHKRLFPDIPMAKSKQRYSATFTKVFANAMKTLKLKKESENFHSFRHTMIDALRAAQVEEGVMMALVGHKDSRQTASYGKGYPLAVLKKAMDKVEYDCIDWSKVGIIATP